MFDILGKTLDFITSDKLAIFHRISMILGIVILLYVADQSTQFSNFFYREKQLELVEKVDRLMAIPGLSVVKQKEFEVIRIDLMKAPPKYQTNYWIGILTSGGYFIITGIFFLVYGLFTHKEREKQKVDFVILVTYFMTSLIYVGSGILMGYMFGLLPIIYSPVFNYLLNILLQANTMFLLNLIIKATRDGFKMTIQSEDELERIPDEATIKIVIDHITKKVVQKWLE